MNELVSIIIPTYNRFSETCRAVESCLTQPYKEIEILICDDKSTDGSFEQLVNKYKENLRIMIFQNNGPKGANSARQCGVNRAKGDTIIFLDSDDCLTSNSIYDRIHVLKENETCVLAYGDSISENGIHKYDDISNFERNKYLMRELSLCEYGTIMIRRSSFVDDGLRIDTSLKAWQDDDMILSVNNLYPTRKNAILHCGHVVLEHNRSEESITSNHRNLYDGLSRILSKYHDNILSECGYRRLFLWKIRLAYRRLWIIYTDTNKPAVRITIGLIRRALYLVCRINFRHLWG